MKSIKCSKCGKSFGEVRFYRDWLMDIRKAVLASPVCLNCSKELVNQSKKYFKNVVFFNRTHYRLEIAEMFIASLFLILISLGFFYYVERSRTSYILYLFFLLSLTGSILVINTIRKYGF